MTFEKLTSETIRLIETEYVNSELPWNVGFSGGKDSSALTILIFQALINTANRKTTVNIMYCDTGVDIPIVRAQVIATLTKIDRIAADLDLPIKTQIAKPEISERFFVKVIGRGYPPPTNIFRWCTRRLRIAPIQKLIEKNSPNVKNVVLLGIRSGESKQRDRAISTYSTDRKHYLKHSRGEKSLIFSPIIEYGVEEVWATIIDNPLPHLINAKELMTLYKDAGGECPVIRDPRGTPCGKGRFGCWTCTVVRNDKAVTSLVLRGYENLAPLLNFRNWLIASRDEPEIRCKKRRNGATGLGPINIAGRRKILERLLETQEKSGYDLISSDELNAIGKLWASDFESQSYNEICEDTAQYGNYRDYIKDSSLSIPN